MESVCSTVNEADVGYADMYFAGWSDILGSVAEAG